jgi:cytochrome c peroxidase
MINKIWKLTALFLTILVPASLASAAVTLPSAVTNADYYDNGSPNPNKVELGRLLFFDKVMSGNQNIACASCHHPYTFTSDRLSLGVGEGSQFHGTQRTTGSGEDAIKGRIGRNAPSLFNVGATEFTRLNLGGVNEQTSSGLKLLSGRFTPTGLDNVLAGQALFPLLSGAEMRGQPGENDVVDTVVGSKLGISSFPAQWEVLIKRLRGIPEYVTRFQNSYSDIVSADAITISHAVNAISAFQATQFRSDNSLFDRFLRGETDALSPAQTRGMDLFYGKANCASCHSGKFQTDHNFHAIAMPQIGPGAQTTGVQKQQDTGRQGVTQLASDFYKFRTPSLRNIVLTGPYGHSGAFTSLDAMIRHHLDPINSFENWDRSQVVLPSRADLDGTDFFIMDDAVSRTSIVNANELSPLPLSDSEIRDVTDFLHALTDPKMLDMRHIIPKSVPSGLPVGD